MNNTFSDCEKLYRAVFPTSYIQMFWKKDEQFHQQLFQTGKAYLLNEGTLEMTKM